METVHRLDGTFIIDVYRYSKVECNVVDSTYENYDGPYVTKCGGYISMEKEEVV
ncbi:MAG: hypothetical protein ABJG68_16385 [Crocinitomicaceae bacterium]